MSVFKKISDNEPDQKPTNIKNILWNFCHNWFGHKLSEPVGSNKDFVINQRKLMF